MFESLKKAGISTVYNYLEKDPEKNLPKLMEWVDRFAGSGEESFEVQRDAFRKVVNDPSSNWYQLMIRLMKDTDPGVLKAIFTNFFMNANLIGWKKQEEYRQTYNCNIPWAILLDPTSACNMHCTGCWAAEYGNKLNLSFDEIDSIISQGKEMGVYLYIYNGGVDPCVFIHYSDCNIREKSLLDCLRSPMFMAYHDGQPFNDNMLHPCPMLENPEKLREMVERTGARSTDMQSPESAEHLCAKCDSYARNWVETADRLWECSCKAKAANK